MFDIIATFTVTSFFWILFLILYKERRRKEEDQLLVMMVLLDRYTRWVSQNVVEDKRVLGGTAVIKGTRLSVSHIGGLARKEGGIQEIKQDYPYLTEEDIQFCRLYVVLEETGTNLHS
jgi:uncharacterized protein (DUF433 family)